MFIQIIAHAPGEFNSFIKAFLTIFCIAFLTVFLITKKVIGAKGLAFYVVISLVLSLIISSLVTVLLIFNNM